MKDMFSCLPVHQLSKFVESYMLLSGESSYGNHLSVVVNAGNDLISLCFVVCRNW